MCVLFVSAVASAAITGSGEALAVFDAFGPAGLKIQGKTRQVTVAQQGGNVVITVASGSFDTGIEIRNRHMRDKYLETGKYPNAVLTVARSALQLPTNGADVSASSAGTLNLHGQTRPITISYRARRAGDTYTVTGLAHINMTVYGIAQPSFLGITVKPDVDVTVSFSAKDN
jgi:polyisoprenoid-binding protein YceI